MIWVVRKFNTNNYDICGFFTVRPRLQGKKYLYITNDPAHRETHEIFCFNDETKEEWKEHMDAIAKMIKDNNCYIKKTDKIVRYEFKDRKRDAA